MAHNTDDHAEPPRNFDAEPPAELFESDLQRGVQMVQGRLPDDFVPPVASLGPVASVDAQTMTASSIDGATDSAAPASGSSE